MEDGQLIASLGYEEAASHKTGATCDGRPLAPRTEGHHRVEGRLVLYAIPYIRAHVPPVSESLVPRLKIENVEGKSLTNQQLPGSLHGDRASMALS